MAYKTKATKEVIKVEAKPKTSMSKKSDKSVIEGEFVDDEDEEKKESKKEEKEEKEDHKELLAQIDVEYEVARRYLKPKWDKWAARLRLYNNQRKDDDTIGDPLLFTIHQTVLASLYDDKLTVSFEGRERE